VPTLLEGAGLEVTSSHPVLDRAEHVFDGSSSDAHGVGHVLEPCLHGLDHVLVLPPLDPPFLSGRASCLRSGRREVCRNASAHACPMRLAEDVGGRLKQDIFRPAQEAEEKEAELVSFNLIERRIIAIGSEAEVHQFPVMADLERIFSERIDDVLE
jgi:hypothetical protein